MDDLGSPSSYLVLAAGTPVYSSDGDEIGKVEHVLADQELDIFDGIVVEASHGVRFVDAPQVDEIYERGVVLNVSSAEAASLPEPTDNPGVMEVDGLEDVDRSELREKLRRAWEMISGKGLG